MKVRRRMLLGLVAVALFGALLVAAGAAQIVRTSVRERYVERIRAETTLLAGWVEQAGQADLQALAVDAGGRLGVRVSLISPNGTVLADSARDRAAVARMDDHSRRPELEAARKAGTGESFRTSATTSEEYFYIARRLGGQGRVGYVRLALPSSDVQRAQRRHFVALFGIVVTSMLILSAVAYAAVLRLSRPVERLTEAVVRAADGDLGLDPPSGGGEEVDRLAEAVRRMQQALLVKVAEVDSERAVLSSVVSGIKEGLLLLDADLRVRLVNGAARQIFELEFDPEGHPLAEVVRHPTVIEQVEAAAEGRGAPPDSMFELPGTGRSFELRVARLDGSGGALDGVIVLVFDVTRLEALERVRREFVANVSHELRTPLTAIVASVESLLDGVMEDRETANRFLEIVRRNAGAMSALIEDLTDLSLIETGSVQLELDTVDVAEVSHEVAERLRPVAEARDISVDLTLPRPSPIRADRRRLEQMVTNLLDNAIKFNRQGGQVRITGSGDGEHYALVVEDTGIGIPADSLDKVDNRFYQVARARSRDRRGGTGLGLAIVKHLMRLHGGRMRVQSELGSGSTFTLEFPKRGQIY